MHCTKYCFVLTVFLFLEGCKKDADGQKDTELPKITMTSPTANQVFAVGEAVIIGADITDNTKLREVHLEIINSNTATLLTHEHYVPGGAAYTLARTFTAQAATSYKIIVDAIDDSGNKAKVETTIFVN